MDQGPSAKYGLIGGSWPSTAKDGAAMVASKIVPSHLLIV
jgi:hypothetical protein